MTDAVSSVLQTSIGHTPPLNIKASESPFPHPLKDKIVVDFGLVFPIFYRNTTVLDQRYGGYVRLGEGILTLIT